MSFDKGVNLENRIENAKVRYEVFLKDPQVHDVCLWEECKEIKVLVGPEENLALGRVVELEEYDSEQWMGPWYMFYKGGRIERGHLHGGDVWDFHEVAEEED